MSIDIRQAVLADMETKIAAGEGLRAANETEQRVREELNVAESAVADARKEALRSGWSEAELKRLGLIGGVRAVRAKKSRGQATEQVHE